MSIEYSDGLEVEALIKSIVADATNLHSSEVIGLEHYDKWPVRYHLTPERANLVRHLDFTGLHVLEIGAGMGGVARYIAEQCAHLTVIEGAETRFETSKLRLRDLDNWTAHLANIQDIELEERFDVVCLFGVLEYLELFVTNPDGGCPFEFVLQKARRHLKEDGVLIVAIENRLGLKYFSGCTEDHSGALFDGVCGYPSSPSAKTFNRAELLGLLERAGYSDIVQQFPYPDYKLTRTVLTKELIDEQPDFVANTVSKSDPLNYSGHYSGFFPPSLMAASLKQSPTQLADFANSFLFFASPSKNSSVMHRLLSKHRRGNEVGWHYSTDRKMPTKTTFLKTSGGLLIDKRPLYDEDAVRKQWKSHDCEITWNGRSQVVPTRGELLSHAILRHAYFDEHEKVTEKLLSYIRWMQTKFPGIGPQTVSGRAIDWTVANAFVASEGFVLIDQEWELTGDMPLSWFVFRNLFANERSIQTISSFHGSPERLYNYLCEELSLTPSLESDVEREVVFQSLVTAGLSPVSTGALLSWFRSKDETSIYSRSAERVVASRQAITKLQAVQVKLQELQEKSIELQTELSRLQHQSESERGLLFGEVKARDAILNRKLYRAARKIDRLLAKLLGR